VQAEGTPARSRVCWPARGYAAPQLEGTPRHVGCYGGLSGGGGPRYSGSTAQRRKSGWAAQGVPTTVSPGRLSAPAIIFAELARPAPHGGLPHDSSCGECAGTTRRKKEKKRKRKSKGARRVWARQAAASSALQRPARGAVPWRPAHRPLARSALLPEAQGVAR
jgi:hypothetical protein